MAGGNQVIDIALQTDPQRVNFNLQNSGGSVSFDLSNGSDMSSRFIDDTAGAGVTNKTWSADKLTTEFDEKADKTDTVLETTLSRGRKANTTVGTGSIAFGYNVEASGSQSQAFGNATKASGSYARSEGNETIASGPYSTAEGYRSVARSTASHAEGIMSTANGSAAHSEGSNSKADGSASHSGGTGTVASHRSQYSFGEYNITDQSTAPATDRGTYIEIVGNGTGNSARSNARTLDWNGNEELAGDLVINKGGTNESSMSDVAEDVNSLKSAINVLAETETSDAEDVDLDVTDENGNVILRLADGHVQTKNFDSSKSATDGIGFPAVKNDSEEDIDLDITDTNGNVLVRYVDGGIQTKKFDSADVSGENGTQTELNLSAYPTVNFNFEYGNTWTSGGYRGVLIPKNALGDKVKFTATSNKIVACFLIDNDIVASELPHTCIGTTVIRMGKGADETLDVPSDCTYLYVYVSQNSEFIGTIHLYAIVNSTKVNAEIAELQTQINEMRASLAFAHMKDTDQIVRTLKHWHTNSFNDFRAYSSGDDLVTIAHISDVHNDPTAYGRFISFLNDEVGVINCGLVTGDIVDGPGSDCFAEMTDEEDELAEGTKLLKVVGNHDRISADLSELFNYMNMEISTSGEELYYVHDFVTQKIRIIVLNQYDSPSGSQIGKTGHYSQNQLDWFCSKLQEAITNDYHVIVAYHSCSEMGLPARNEKGFCQNTYMGFNESVSGEHIIEDIVNAFQNAGSVSKSITYPDTETTVTVSATFASKGTFVCYMCGHAHVDFIGYSRVYPKQLVCMVQGAVIDSTKRNEATAHWQGQYDTPRVCGTSTADSINVYAIDPMARLVKVAKIGSTLTDKFVPRSFAIYGY